MQEIQALDHEVKRLKEVRAIHKEYRRYAEMPSKFNSNLIFFSGSYVASVHLLSGLEQEKASLFSRVLRKAMQKIRAGEDIATKRKNARTNLI